MDIHTLMYMYRCMYLYVVNAHYMYYAHYMYMQQFMICCRRAPSAIECGAPPSGQHVLTPIVRDTSLHAVATYHCLPGYWFRPGVYQAESTCGSDGAWTLVDVDCTGRASPRCLTAL